MIVCPLLSQLQLPNLIDGRYYNYFPLPGKTDRLVIIFGLPLQVISLQLMNEIIPPQNHWMNKIL